MWQRRLGLLLLAGFVAWPVAFVLYTRPHPSLSPAVGGLLVSHRPEIAMRLALVFAFWCLLSVLYLFLTAPRRRGPRRGYAVMLLMGQVALVDAVALVVLTPVGLLYTFRWRPWSDLDHLRAPDGRVYHVQLHEEALRSRLALTEEVSRGPWFLTTRVVALSTGEYRAMGIVRPDRDPRYRLEDPSPRTWSGRGRLVLDASGRWLTFLHRTRDEEVEACLLDAAYDLQEHRAYLGPQLLALSPFLLLGSDGLADPKDLSGLRAALADPAMRGTRWPTATLEAASRDRNPHVRAAARQLLSTMQAAPDTRGPAWYGPTAAEGAREWEKLVGR